MVVVVWLFGSKKAVTIDDRDGFIEDAKCVQIYRSLMRPMLLLYDILVLVSIHALLWLTTGAG